MDLNKLSSYQNPKGKLKDRLAPRTDLRLSMFEEKWFADRSVLDLGCNNGYFTRLAKKAGATRAVGVDKSDCIIGARELAKEEGLDCEFWQTSLDSVEFRRHCPRFDTVLLLSVITHLKDKEEFLNWLDSRVKHILIFESNHGEPNKEHIQLVKKHIHFAHVNYLGVSDIPEKPHHLWECKKAYHEVAYRFLESAPIEWVPLDKIETWTEKRIMNQKAAYRIDSDKFILLQQDIKERGIRDPLILIDDNGKYLGWQGAHRYFAAKALGYKDVPCKIIRGKRFKRLDKQYEI